MDLSKYWTLRRLAFLCQGDVIQGDPDLRVRSICTDTRTLKKGDVFWALEGANRDGNAFAVEAVQKGASAVVLSRAPEPGAFKLEFPIVQVRKGIPALGRFAEAHRLLFKDLTVVGITGSNGKTTTKEMIARILRAHKPTFASPGNFNNEIGCPLAMLELTQQHCYGVFEMAARKPGDIEWLSTIAHPQVAVLTNIGPAHLATFGSLERIWETKSEILRGLTADGIVIYWAEDPWLSRLQQMHLPQRLISFGFSEHAHLRANMLSSSPKGTVLEVFWQDRRLGTLDIKLTGRGNALNALAACACGLALEVSAKTVLSALSGFEGVAMRGERISLDHRVFSPIHVVIHDAYNANPASMADSVNSFLATFSGYRKIVVLGAMHELGLEAGRWHSDTARSILNANTADHTLDEHTLFILVGGGPVQEMANTLQTERKAGQKYQVFHETRAQALSRIRSLLSQDIEPCAVLFKASRAEAFEDLVEELRKPI